LNINEEDDEEGEEDEEVEIKKGPGLRLGGYLV